jgi:hypothetical protein
MGSSLPGPAGAENVVRPGHEQFDRDDEILFGRSSDARRRADGHWEDDAVPCFCDWRTSAWLTR